MGTCWERGNLQESCKKNRKGGGGGGGDFQELESKDGRRGVSETAVVEGHGCLSVFVLLVVGCVMYLFGVLAPTVLSFLLSCSTSYAGRKAEERRGEEVYIGMLI